MRVPSPLIGLLLASLLISLMLACARAHPAPAACELAPSLDPTTHLTGEPLRSDSIGSRSAAIPNLTDAERRAAYRAIVADARMQRLLCGRDWSVEAIGVWHVAELKLGATVGIRVAEPFTATLDWPAVQYARVEGAGEHQRAVLVRDSSGEPLPPEHQYRVRSRRRTERAIRRLHVLVDP